MKTAKEVQPEETDNMLYCMENDRYYEDLDDYYYNLEFDKTLSKNPPKRLRVTEAVKLQLDAKLIVEDACDELHEGAYENCDIEGLQKLLDAWCKEQTGATTYYPNYVEYVVVKKQEFEVEE